MRLRLLVGTLLVSAPAMAIEPPMLPQSGEIASEKIPTPSFMAEPDMIASGVPVEAVLGSDDNRTGWVAGATDMPALGGLDPVSFFEPGGPKPGRAEHRAEYHGSVFYFADRQHRDLFVASPEAYAPAFGGYDPEALARGLLVPASPENWTVYDGRLFFSGSPRLKSEFDRHKPEVIKAAQTKWEAVDRMFQDRFFKAHQD
jgi:YHS domain-containing protein